MMKQYFGFLFGFHVSKLFASPSVHVYFSSHVPSSQVASKVCPFGSLHSTRSTWGSPAAASVRSCLRLMFGGFREVCVHVCVCEAPSVPKSLDSKIFHAMLSSLGIS